MNRAQRVVIVIGLLVIAAMVVCPPWLMRGRSLANLKWRSPCRYYSYRGLDAELEDLRLYLETNKTYRGAIGVHPEWYRKAPTFDANEPYVTVRYRPLWASQDVLYQALDLRGNLQGVRVKVISLQLHKTRLLVQCLVVAAIAAALVVALGRKKRQPSD